MHAGMGIVQGNMFAIQENSPKRLTVRSEYFCDFKTSVSSAKERKSKANLQTIQSTSKEKG